MSAKLKNLKDQVVVVTGASSGIGLATAGEAARRGAKVVLAARSEQPLNDVVGRVTAAGGDALAVRCDVADRAQVDALAAAAVARYGRIDTWVNNAGLGIWGRLDETPEPDARRLFDINFWGVVHGCQSALPHLKANGGALITTGSEVSDAFTPLLGVYVASKHAVKGYVDCLRTEVEEMDKAPVSITLIEPTAVDTPFAEHARNVTDREPRLPTPRVEAKGVAAAILAAAETPTREKTVGGTALMNTLVAKLFPSLGDKMGPKRVDQMHYDEPPRNPAGTLTESAERAGTAGRTHGSGGREPK